MERINQSTDEALKLSMMEKEKEKIKKLIYTMRFFYREMTMIKENLKEFYQQVREEYIFGWMILFFSPTSVLPHSFPCLFYR